MKKLFFIILCLIAFAEIKSQAKYENSYVTINFPNDSLSYWQHTFTTLKGLDIKKRPLSIFVPRGLTDTLKIEVGYDSTSVFQLLSSRKKTVFTIPLDSTQNCAISLTEREIYPFEWFRFKLTSDKTGSLILGIGGY